MCNYLHLSYAGVNCRFRDSFRDSKNCAHERKIVTLRAVRACSLGPTLLQIEPRLKRQFLNLYMTVVYLHLVKFVAVNINHMKQI